MNLETFATILTVFVALIVTGWMCSSAWKRVTESHERVSLTPIIALILFSIIAYMYFIGSLFNSNLGAVGYAKNIPHGHVYKIVSYTKAPDRAINKVITDCPAVLVLENGDKKLFSIEGVFPKILENHRFLRIDKNGKVEPVNFPPADLPTAEAKQNTSKE